MGGTVKSISDIDLKDILKKLNKGCIYFIFRDKKDISIHIFTVKDGEIVSIVFTDGQLWNTCGDTEMAYEIMQDINKKVVLYLVEEEKVVGQLFICSRSIGIRGDSRKIDNILNRNIIKICCKDIYLNTPYIKYLRCVDKNKLWDFESYLEEGKYYLVHINLSVLTIYRNGYVIYEGKKPIMAAYEDNYGVLCGDLAYRKIKKLMEKSISTIDIYQYREDAVKTLLERYPEMRIEEKDKKTEITETTQDILEVVDKEVSPSESGGKSTFSREELLKKFGLEDPDEKWIEKVLKEAYAPSFEELLHLKREIEKEIVKRCREIKGVKDVKVSLDITWEDRIYFIEGKIKVETKKLLGIILERVDPGLIEKEIDNVIKKYIPTKYSSKISINIL